MAQGTYSELCSSGLDVVSLLRSDEEQERLAQSTDADKLSSHSQRTHDSHCSYSSLLPPESDGTEQLPVGTSSGLLCFVWTGFVVLWLTVCGLSCVAG